MSDDRKTPLWPWIVCLLIGVPVLYVVSFGPACRVTSRVYASGESCPANPVMFVYFPLGKTILHNPNAGFGRSLIWWITTCIPKGHTAIIPTLVEGRDRLAIENP
jgi:hypothetical protein